MDANSGVRINTASTVSAGGGTVVVSGTGGVSLSGGLFNRGVEILGGSRIATTFATTRVTTAAGNTGVLVIEGTAGTGSDQNEGVIIGGTDSTVETEFGDLTIVGIGNSGSTGVGNEGVEITGTAIIGASNSGNVTITGTGGGGTLNNQGISMFATSEVRVFDGDATLTGSTGEGNSRGVSLHSPNPIVAAGTGNAAIISDTDLTITGSVDSGNIRAITMQLNGVLGVPGNNRDVDQFLISPDGQTVVYIADQDSNDVLELYSVSISGGPVTKISGPMVSGGDVGSPSLGSLNPHFLITADSSRVVYLADQDVNGRVELYSVAMDGSDMRRISGDLQVNGDVSQFRLSPDGRFAVYLADAETDSRSELYSVRVDGTLPVVKLNPNLVGGRVNSNPLISDDGSTVVFVASSSSVFDIFAADITGATSAVNLTASISDSTSLRYGDIDISSDGSVLAFAVDRTSFGFDQL
ncbi:MAG: hypothetical protein KDA89_20210, partial [Planctomycetaceae bacterium]|nr:hypothetical protein [Planctomycetaceae bacterium]